MRTWSLTSYNGQSAPFWGEGKNDEVDIRCLIVISIVRTAVKALLVRDQPFLFFVFFWIQLVFVNIFEAATKSLALSKINLALSSVVFRTLLLLFRTTVLLN